MGRDLTEGSVLRTILVTALPMVVAFGLQSAFNIVDAYFVGKISADALAAVSVSFPVIFLLISLSTGIGVGATSLIARYVGAKKTAEAGDVAEHALLISLVLALVFTVVGVLAAPLLFDLMGVSAAVKTLSVDYITIILYGSPFMFLAMVGNSIIRGEGEMKVPMYVMGAGALLNIILDPIFIFTLGLGVRGAAIATVVSRSLTLLIVVAYFVSDKTWIKIKFRQFKFNIEYVKGIFSVGLPSSLSNLSMSLGMFLLTAIVAGFGTEAIAAFGVGFRLDSLAVLPSIGISVAVVSIVGQSVGARQFSRAEETTYKAGFLATILMSLIGAVLFLFAEPIMLIFNNDPLVVAYGVGFLRIIPLSYLFVGLSMSISGAFLGSGHAIPSLVLTALRAVVISIPLAVLLSQRMGLAGVWWGIISGSLAGTIISIAWFRKGTWKKQVHHHTRPAVSS